MTAIDYRDKGETLCADLKGGARGKACQDEKKS